MSHFRSIHSFWCIILPDSIHNIVTYETVLFPSSISLPLISGGETRIHPYKDRNAIANTKYLFNALFIFFSFGENTRNIRIIDNQYRIKIQHARRFRFRQIHIYIDGWRRDEAERSFKWANFQSWLNHLKLLNNPRRKRSPEDRSQRD